MRRQAKANRGAEAAPVQSIATTPARCPQCFSRQATVAEQFVNDRDAAPWHVVTCSDCGLMFTDCRPAAQDWDRFYGEGYPAYRIHRKQARWYRPYRDRLDAWLLRTYRGYPSRSDERPDHQQWLPTLLSPLCGRRLDPYVLPLHGTGRLLDVGCGNGTYLARMRALGWTVVGMERCRWIARRVHQRFGIEVVGTGLPTNELPQGRFDMVTLWQVLEHIERPRQALGCIRELLYPNGRLALTVPNQAGWSARFFGPAWAGLDLPRHLVHFTPETLKTMLRSEGFSVVHQTTIGASGWIRHSARRAVRLRRPLRERLFASKALSRAASALACHRREGESIYVIAQPEAS